MSAQLTPREREVLYSIVEEYIESGEPVASRTISKQRKDALSPASIRNVMADLAEAGYLEQPHTSAGRVPTARAFRVYVQWLASHRLPAIDLDRFRATIAGADSLADWVERSSHLLTELTNNVGIAAAFPASSRKLDRIELVKLADRRVLMVVITRDQIVRDKLVTLAEDIAPDELQSIRNYLNENFGGWNLDDVRQELKRRLEQDSAAYDAILKHVMMLYGKGLLDIDTAPECSIEGAANLVTIDLHLTRERMRELFRALEEKKRMLQLLDRFLEQAPGEIGIYIGLGDAHPAMKPLSLIGLNVVLPGGMAAKIAVLGPMRMNYERVVSAVLQVGDALRERPL